MSDEKDRGNQEKKAAEQGKKPDKSGDTAHVVEPGSQDQKDPADRSFEK